jgi:hypothetical protein
MSIKEIKKRGNKSEKRLSTHLDVVGNECQKALPSLNIKR